MFINNSVTNFGGLPTGGSGTLAQRPAAGLLGRIYIATDTLELYRDTGLTWTTIGGPGSGTVTGTGTVNEITFWNGAGSIGSLSTTTYPSLTELSYVKGVTSGIQGQINAKQDAISLTTSGTSGAATFIGNTLNIPQYQAALTNPVTGTGAAGQAAFWTGANDISGDNAFYWDNTNKRLGINTVNPGSRLDIHGSSVLVELNGVTTNNAYIDYKNAGSQKWTLGNTYAAATNRYSIFNATATEIFTILQSGNIGLTQNAPANTLSINGNASIGYNNAAPSNGLIVNGNVGIGTFSPTEKLEVSGNILNNGRIRTRYNSTSPQTIDLLNDNGFGTYTFMGIEGTTGGTLLIGSIAGASLFGTSFNKPVQIGTNNNVRLTILEGGNVGIDTTNPTEKLHVIGNGIISQYFDVGTASTNANAYVRVLDGSVINKIQSIGSSNVGYLGTESNHNLQLITNNVPKVTITNAGITNVLSRLNVNGATDNANFELNNNGNLYTGGISPTVLTVNTTPYTIARTATGYYCAAGASVLNLPAANGLNNTYYIINDSGGNITVNRAGADTILDLTGTAVTSITIADNERAMFYQGGGTQTYLIFQS